MAANRIVFSWVVMVMAGLAACSQQQPTSKSADAEDRPASDAPIAPAFGSRSAFPATLASSVQSGATPAFGFRAHRQYMRQQGPSMIVYEAIAAADYTGDGRTDLVALPHTHNQIELFVQQPDGVLAPPRIFPFGGENSYVGRQMVTNDFNGDQISDVAFPTVSASGSSGGIGLLLSTKGGAPVYRQGYPDGAVGGAASIGATLDVDGDGRQDIVGAHNVRVDEEHERCGAPPELYCPGYSVSYGDGRGNFSAPQVFQLRMPFFVRELAAHDLNSDGTTDLVMAMAALNDPTSSGQLMVADRLPGGGLAAPRKLYSTPSILEPVVFGDMNGDGLDDTLTGGFEVHLQSVDGSFGPALYLSTATMDPRSAIVADFDGDGYKDVINHQFSGFGTVPFLAVYLQRNKTLAAPFLIQDPAWNFAFHVSNHPLAYAAGDLNGDGCNDLAVAVGADGISFLDGINCTRRVIPRPDESRFYRTRPASSPGKTQPGKAGSRVRLVLDGVPQ
ncbi:MAG: VCBS repeat-containing protein [Sphingomonadales bacterium]|nr:MAG: VCBS repeat-containing protein [Sphingomonadales bacterium]